MLLSVRPNLNRHNEDYLPSGSLYSWFSLTGYDGHIGVQNNGKTSHNNIIKVPKDFFANVLCTNMAAVTSHENQE